MSAGPDDTPPPARLIAWVIAPVVLVGVALRLAWLDTVPGLNADEAWYGTRLLAGRFSWSTPTGNPLNPFHMVPLAALHAVAPHSVLALRGAAAAYGVALLALAPRLLRGSLGPLGVAVFVALAASSPDLIAYSRIGWDSEASCLATLAALAFALARRWAGALLALAASILVHPSNACIAVALVALRAVDVAALPAPQRRRAAVTAALIVAPLPLLALSIGRVREALSLGEIARRLVNPSGWLWALERYSELISGVSLYRWLAGPVPPVVAGIHAAAFWGVAIPVVVAGARSHALRGERRPLALAASVPLAALGLYVALGETPLDHPFSRYAQFLVAPTLVALGWCAAPLGEGAKARRVLAAAALMAALSLLGCARYLLLPHLDHGGDVHRALRSGTVEPKLAVARILTADDPPQGAVVLAEDWWLSVPLTYLLPAARGVEVRRFAAVRGLRVHADPSEPGRVLREGGYIVAWIGGPVHTALGRSAGAQGLMGWTVPDSAGRPLVGVWRVARARDAARLR